MIAELETPTIAIISAGAMGAGIARRLTSSTEGHNPCIVLTVVTGRSQETRKRAEDAGMQVVPSLAEVIRKFPNCKWILSILPPSQAEGLVREFVLAVQADHGNQRDEDDGARAHLKEGGEIREYPVFVDCNAKSPNTARKFGQIIHGAAAQLTFIDASIIGLPPNNAGHDPTIYASASPDPGHQRRLSQFKELSKFGLKVKAMAGNGVDVGDASALKMTFSGIMKGMVGLYSTMILAAHAHSPATAKALIEELHDSQPMHLRNVAFYVPNAFSKAYRFVHEMDEMASFLHDVLDGGKTSDHSVSKMFNGFGGIFNRVASSESGDHVDVDVLSKFASYADELSKLT